MTHVNNERRPLRTFALGALLTIMNLGLLPSIGMAAEPANPTDNKITVYKSPTCGCCGKWIDHLKANGFEVDSVNMKDMRLIKSMSGIAPQQASCHTAKVGGYVVEGHVPAEDIKRMLSEKPDIHGLAVPGMPMGSPGMEGPKKDAYDVLSIRHDGSTEVYARH